MRDKPFRHINDKPFRDTAETNDTGGEKYEDQPFVWTEDWTQDDMREMAIARFDRIFRERYDRTKKARTLDTIGEMEADAIDAFWVAFVHRMKRARSLVRRGFGLEIPPD